MREELEAILRELMASSAPGEPVSLDAIGDVIGARAVAAHEIEALLDALEAAGRPVEAASDSAVLSLRRVIACARDLERTLGRRPAVDEIARVASLPEASVRAALRLAQVMSR